jgi:hypothetical protein
VATYTDPVEKSWVMDSYEDFAEGTTKGTELENPNYQGKIILECLLGVNKPGPTEKDWNPSFETRHLTLPRPMQWHFEDPSTGSTYEENGEEPYEGDDYIKLAAEGEEGRRIKKVGRLILHPENATPENLQIDADPEKTFTIRYHGCYENPALGERNRWGSIFNLKLALALAASLAAGALCFASTAAELGTSAEPATSAEAATTGPAAAAPYTAPRYFNPYTPRQDNPTNPPGTWEVYPSPTGNDLYCVDFVDANNGWAGGRSIALRYRNGTWSVIPGHSGHVFEDIDMLSLRDGWAVGWDGNKLEPAIWRWNGSDWKEFQNPTGGVNCIDMLNPNLGWIGGNRYFLRFNGSSWVSIASAPSSMFGIHMFSDSDGRAVGYRYIMRRTSSGWAEESYNNWVLADVFMVSRNEGFASGYERVSEKGILVKYDGIWRVYKIFDGVTSIGRIEIYQGDFGWATGARKTSPPLGAFLAFFNGKDWAVVPDPTDKGLGGIKIIDRNAAWIVGEAGIILKYKPNISIIPVSLGRIKAIYR